MDRYVSVREEYNAALRQGILYDSESSSCSASTTSYDYYDSLPALASSQAPRGAFDTAHRSSAASSSSAQPRLAGAGDEAAAADGPASQAPPGHRTGTGTSRGRRELSEEEMATIPRTSSGTLTSLGTVNHATGECSPCLFFLLRRGCSSGPACEFCHLPHRASDSKRGGEAVNKEASLRAEREQEKG